MPLSFADKLNNFPPIFVRLLARNGRSGNGCRPLTTAHISARSGLPPALVEGLSLTTSWQAVPCCQMLAFTAGCGLPLDHPRTVKRTLDYLRHQPNFDYLYHHPQWRTYYRPMLLTWGRHASHQTGLFSFIALLAKRLSKVQSHDP